MVGASHLCLQGSIPLVLWVEFVAGSLPAARVHRFFSHPKKPTLPNPSSMWTSGPPLVTALFDVSFGRHWKQVSSFFKG